MRLPTTQGSLYEWWYAALKVGVGVPGKTDVHENQPHCGRYKMRREKGEPWVPVAIWPFQEIDENGELIADEVIRATVGFDGDRKTYASAEQIWLWCAKWPITNETYEAACKAGRFPDEIEGANAPPGNTFETLRDEINSALALAEKFTAVEDELTCNQVANLKTRLSHLWDAGETMRKAEKKPFDDGAKAVQNKWNPILSGVKDACEHLRLLMTPYMRKAQEKVEEAAKAVAEQSGVASAAEAPRAKFGGQSGKRVSLRTIKRVEITDYEAVYAALKDNAGVREAVEEIAGRLVKAGQTIPGTKLIEEKVAA